MLRLLLLCDQAPRPDVLRLAPPLIISIAELEASSCAAVLLDHVMEESG